MNVNGTTGQADSFYVSKTKIILFFLFTLQITIATLFFMYYQDDYYLNSSSFLTYDSFLYRERAIEYINFDFSFIDFIKQYSLNYSTISVLASLAYVDAIFYDSLIFLFNSTLLLLTYILLAQLLLQEKIEINVSSAIVLALFMYIPFSLVQLNKEIIGIAFVVFSLYAYHKKYFFALLFIGLLFGLVRIQYFAVVFLILFFSSSRLITMLLIMNVITLFFIEPQVLAWSNAVGGDINSLELMLFIEEIAQLPLIGVIAHILRVFVSMLTGIYSPIIYVFTSQFDAIYHTSIFLLSSTFFYSIYLYSKTKKYYQKVPGLLYSNLIVMVSFTIVMSLAPYLQPRYYLPLIIPLIINYLCIRRLNKSNMV